MHLTLMVRNMKAYTEYEQFYHIIICLSNFLLTRALNKTVFQCQYTRQNRVPEKYLYFGCNHLLWVIMHVNYFYLLMHYNEHEGIIFIPRLRLWQGVNCIGFMHQRFHSYVKIYSLILGYNDEYKKVTPSIYNG